MIIDEIFTKYWNQITIFLFAIGYFVKLVFDNLKNKREINHNLFQQNRLNSLNRFFKSYSGVEQMLISMPIFDILDRKISAKQLDTIVFPPLNDLKASVVELQIYFKPEDHLLFKEILNNIILVKDKIGELYLRLNRYNNDIAESNTYQYIRIDKLKENEKLLDKISFMIQETFK